MKQVVFLLEEPSMKEFLEGFMPRAFPGVEFLCIKHEGKQDLEKSIPRKLKAWGRNEATFIVVRDNDQAQCKKVKRKLQDLCRMGGRPDTLIRIVCQALESWYIGSPGALAVAYEKQFLVSIGNKRKYRTPDQLASPFIELQQIIPEFRKIDGARRMGYNMPIDEGQNNSHSFNIFVKGLRRKLKA